MPPQRLKPKFLTQRNFIPRVSRRSSVSQDSAIIEQLNIQFREIQLDLSAGKITDRQAAVKYLELAEISASAGLEYKSLGYQIQAQSLVNKSDKAGVSAGNKAAKEAQDISEEELKTMVNELEDQIKIEFDKVGQGATPLDVYDAVSFLINSQLQAVVGANIDEELRSDLIDYFVGNKEWKGIDSRSGFHASTLGESLKEFMDVADGNIYKDYWNLYDMMNKGRDVVDDGDNSIWVWEQVVKKEGTGIERGSQRWVVADSSQKLFQDNADLFAIDKVNENSGATFRNVYYYSPILLAKKDDKGRPLFTFLDGSSSVLFQDIKERDLTRVELDPDVNIGDFLRPFGNVPVHVQREFQKKLQDLSSKFIDQPNLFLGDKVSSSLSNESVTPTQNQSTAPAQNMSIEPTSSEAARQANPLGLPGKFEAAGLQQFKNIFFPSNPISRK